MMEKELADQLSEAGKNLLQRPSASNELVSLLEKIESCLQRVEQSPSPGMLSALEPSKEALIASDLLHHSDMGVKVIVASCISEITRITAPEAPYDDDLMKEIFRIIVASFEDLFDESSCLHSKRVSILETVAKVRSCVVMLDLECDDLILEMFQHFLDPIRESIQENIFSSMETIMTMVLEESEDISSDILSCLLKSVENEKQDVSPVAYKLGEKVITSCSEKLKPYLMQEVQSKGINLDKYSKVVASLCQEKSVAAGTNVRPDSEQKLTDERKSSERTDSDVPPQVDSKGAESGPAVKSPRSVTSNGTIQTEKDARSRKKEPEHSPASSQSKTPVASVQVESDQARKSKRGRKPSVTRPTEASRNNRITNERESAEGPDEKDDVNNKTNNPSLPEDPAAKGAVASDSERKPEVSSPIESHNKTANVGALSPNQGLADSAHRPKRGRPPGKKKVRNSNAEADFVTTSESKASVSADHIEGKTPQIVDSNKKSENVHDSGIRKLKGRSKKISSVDNKKVSTGQSAERKSKDLSAEISEEKAKRRKGSLAAEKDAIGGPSKKKMGSADKSTAKASTTSKSLLEETPKTKPKRRHGQTTEGDSEVSLDEKIVGLKIKVWWPEDHKFYRGVVHQFDPVKKKHKILYNDGDEEVLLLRDEKWEFIKDDDISDTDQVADILNQDASPERQRRKKMKKSPESSSRQVKMDGSLKRRATSTGKGKVDDAKFDAKLKGSDTPKSSGKSKESRPKAVSKSKDDPLSNKSKDEGPRSGSKYKDETTSRSGAKSRGETPKAGGKSNTNGSSSVKGKLSSSKISRGEDTAKGKLGSADARESDFLTGKKRRRKAQS